MATAYTFTFTQPWSAQSIMSAPVETEVRTDPIAEELSGIEINQNGAISGKISLANSKMVWQSFRFPADYARGVTGGKVVIPKLSGFHLNVEVEANKGPAAGLDWFIDFYQPYKGWTGVVKGTEVGSPGEGEAVWFDVSFTPVDITDFWWRKFRLGIRGRTGGKETFREPVEYDKNTHLITINDYTFSVMPELSAAPLTDGGRYFFNWEGNPSMIEIIAGDAYFTEQHGIKNVLYTAPNPFDEAASTEYLSTVAGSTPANEEFEKIEGTIPFAVPRNSEELGVVTIPRIVEADIETFEPDGVTPFTQPTGENVGSTVSLRFRVLSTAPDTDRDCTGSQYRTVATASKPESIKSSVGNFETSYWLSGPNPSQFACEALYMDISENGEASVVDHMVIDPVTPGVYMNVYYTEDEGRPETTEEWDGLLWTPVPQQWLLRRKESFALPEPITARKVKLEFTRLQPAWYSAGSFQRPTQYRKHPSWVWAYYLCLYEELRAATLEEASTVNVTYDTLDLAYNYYLGDIAQDIPASPTTVTSAEGISLLSNALTKAEEEEESTVDSATLAKINTSFNRFKVQPGSQGSSFTSLIQRITNSTGEVNNYPTEGVVTTTANTTQVTSVERDNVIIEKQMPVTQFYLECRHYYAISEAEFETEKAYFVGLKEVLFTRDHYEALYDNELYIETVGDGISVESNDLLTEGHTWVTYTENKPQTLEEHTSNVEPEPELEPTLGLEPETGLEPF